MFPIFNAAVEDGMEEEGVVRRDEDVGEVVVTEEDMVVVAGDTRRIEVLIWTLSSDPIPCWLVLLSDIPHDTIILCW